MRVLSWNIAGLPSKINILGNPVQKIPKMLDKILEVNPQVICLQEVFCYKLQDKLNQELKNQGYNIHTSKNEGLISKNGLLTATQKNISYKTEIDYSMYTGAEYLIKKGLLTTYIKDFNTNILIHNTHLQSNSIYHMQKICSRVRQKQKTEVVQHLKKNIFDFNILCGDLNDDFNSLEHQTFLKTLPFSRIMSNPNKIITFPKYKAQLDYIIINKKIKVKYDKIDVTTQNISDHDILLANLTIPENQPVLPS
tara:strand:+ start:72 stop:827 length:756 start_codon:yes stop_codon:yes gene_type:complete